jgi:hypothetical protein
VIDSIDEENERDAITIAYYNELEGMFTTLVSNAISDGEEMAIQRFARRLKLIRSCRDAAMRCLKGE